MEGSNTITVKGNPMTLLGEAVREGQTAPGFKVVNTELKDVAFDEFKGKVKLIASVPSLDTPVCDLEIKRFNEEAVKLSKEIEIIFISMDLPFAQKRFCQANEIKQVTTFSDYREADFGLKYGVLIKGLRLLARAIFVIDRNDVIRYVEYVPEITSHPNYEATLNILKGLV